MDTARSTSPPPLLTTEEAAKLLGIKVGRLHDRWREWAGFPRPFVVGRTLRWRASELTEWLESTRAAR